MDGAESVVFFGWLWCAWACGIIGHRHRIGTEAFLLGLLLGPVGIPVAFTLDRRPWCPACCTRLDGRASVCPSCRSPLVWIGDRPEVKK